MKFLLLAYVFLTGILIDEVGESVNIANPLIPNGEDVVIQGIDYTADFIDLLSLTPNSPSGTLDIALSSIPIIDYNNMPYFEFMVRLNETGGPNNFASLTQYEFAVGNTTLFRLVESVTGAGDGSLTFGEMIDFTDFGPGNNQADGSIKLPMSLFNGYSGSDFLHIEVEVTNIDAGADFLSINGGTFLGANDVIGDPPVDPPVPEPSRIILIMLGSFLAVLMISRRRKR